MNDRSIRDQIADHILRNETTVRNAPALMGFDGFVDEIVRLVDKKEADGKYTFIPTISAFAERLSRAAGKSTNVELQVRQIKLGGNGPIMANAMLQFGLQITYIGNLGYPEIHPVFHDFASRAKVYSIAEPGHTDALEFSDGKIMLGKYQALDDIDYARIVQSVGTHEFSRLWNESRFYALVNWTMIQHMTSIWETLLEKHCQPAPEKMIFFDLADPEKRTADDIRKALDTLARFARFYHVILGMNEKESMEIAEVLGIPTGPADLDGLQRRAADIRQHLNIQTVVIHPVKLAVAASENTTAGVHGPYIEHPTISTGGGDHFNAGFCLGLLLGLDLTGALYTGVGTSGYYVRTATSPNLPQLADFIRTWKLPGDRP